MLRPRKVFVQWDLFSVHSFGEYCVSTYWLLSIGDAVLNKVGTFYSLSLATKKQKLKQDESKQYLLTQGMGNLRETGYCQARCKATGASFFLYLWVLFPSVLALFPNRLPPCESKDSNQHHQTCVIPTSQQQQGNKPLFSQHYGHFEKKFWLVLRGSFAEQLRFQSQWRGHGAHISDLPFWLLCLLLQCNMWGHMIDRTTKDHTEWAKALP